MHDTHAQVKRLMLYMTAFLKRYTLEVNVASKTREGKCAYTPLQYLVIRYLQEGRGQPKAADLAYINLLVRYQADIHKTCCADHSPIKLIQERNDSRLTECLKKIQALYDVQSDFYGLSLQIPITFQGGMEELKIEDPLVPGQHYVRDVFSRALPIMGLCGAKKLKDLAEGQDIG